MSRVVVLFTSCLHIPPSDISSGHSSILPDQPPSSPGSFPAGVFGSRSTETLSSIELRLFPIRHSRFRIRLPTAVVSWDTCLRYALVRDNRNNSLPFRVSLVLPLSRACAGCCPVPLGLPPSILFGASK